MLFPEFARDPSFVERFRREAQNAAMLNHPNIVSVYDYGQERGTYFIVMEYVEGPSVRDVLRTDGPLPIMQAARITAEIAGALDFAHRHGVVHRDVKPGNVLITPSGQVKVTDFGIAANPTDAGHGLTQTGAVIGTATYFSPEQAQGYQVDGRSDVYALGVVLYEMVTGQSPVQRREPGGGRDEARARAGRAADAGAPRRAAAQLEQIILKAAHEGPRRCGTSRPRRCASTSSGSDAAGPSSAVPTPVDDAAPTMAATGAATMPVESDEMWEDEQERRRWGSILATVLGLGLLAAVIIFAIFFLGNDEGGNAPPKVEVPNVLTKTYAEASAMLEAAGFKATRDRRGERRPDRHRHRSVTPGGVALRPRAAPCGSR